MLNEDGKYPTELVVEIGNTHEGSLGIAKSYIDILRKCKVKIVKFQMHLPDYESSKYEIFRVNFSEQDSTRAEYWRRTGFTEEQWISLASYCISNDIEFLCTPFSIEAAQILLKNNLVKRWKVGSGDALNFPLIDYLIESKLPIIISTGLVTESEIDEIVDKFSTKGAIDRLTLLHCVSLYPVNLSEIGLNQIKRLRDKYKIRVGYSDHSGKLSVAMASIVAGAKVLEVHFTIHPEFFGPDTKSSLNSNEILILQEFIETTNKLMKSPVSKDTLIELARENRELFGRGIYWNRSLTKGTVVAISDLIFLKPALGIKSKFYTDIVGMTTDRDVEAGEPVFYEDLGLVSK